MLTIYTVGEDFAPKRVQFSKEDLKEIEDVYTWVKNLELPFSERNKKYIEISFAINGTVVLVTQKRIDVGHYGWEDWVSYLHPKGTEFLKLTDPYFSYYFLQSWKQDPKSFRKIILKKHRSYFLLKTMIGNGN